MGVQVDGKGPRTLCYSTSGDAARAVDASRVFFVCVRVCVCVCVWFFFSSFFLREARKQTGH